MTQFILRVSLIVCALLVILTVASRVIGGMTHSPIVSYEANGVVLFDLAHGLAVPLSVPIVEGEGETTWSRDGKLAFTSFTGDADDVFVFDPATGSTLNISATLTGSGSQPDWSPDGSKIAFTSGFGEDGTIYIWNAIDDSLTPVSPPDEFVRGNPLWSPDGRYLVYGMIEPGRSGIQIKVISIETGEWVASAYYTSVGVPANPYTWSADSSTLAFTFNPDSSLDVLLLDISSGDITNLTEHRADDFSPVYSPDGRFLAFSSNREATFMELYILNLASNEMTNISNDPLASDFDLAWSPDSQQIAFVSQRNGNYGIYVYTLATGSLASIPGDPAENNFNPSWLP